MTYKVFISHSVRDLRVVTSLANLLSRFGVEVAVAEWYLTPGQPLDQKVFGQIRDSDCIVVFLTQNGIRSNWVQQEIGYALRCEKRIIPLVEKGIRPEELGALQSREYIEYDPLWPQEALVKASTYVRSLGLQKEDREKALLVVGGILAFLLLASGTKE